MNSFKDAPIDTILYALGFLLASIKVLLSGNIILGVKMSNFSAGDFAIMVGALGGVHVARRHSATNKESVK